MTTTHRASAARTRGTAAVAAGGSVHGSDGGTVGTIVAVLPSHVVVEQGVVFPTDRYIPTGAVASAAADRVYLNVTKDEALSRDWDAAGVEGWEAEGGALGAHRDGPIQAKGRATP